MLRERVVDGCRSLEHIGDLRQPEPEFAQQQNALQAHERGQLDAGQTIVCTLTGNGLKDPQWALEAAPDPIIVPVDAAVAAAALGLRG